VADGGVRVLSPADLAFRQDPQIPGAAIAVVAGDPAAAVPYTLRVRFDADAVTSPHRHPDARVVTVLDGEYRFAVGERFDGAALQAHGPGTVLLVPAGTPHFSAAGPAGALVQESGVGPT